MTGNKTELDNRSVVTMRKVLFSSLFVALSACGSSQSSTVEAPVPIHVAEHTTAQNVILIVVDSLSVEAFNERLMPGLMGFASAGVRLEGRSPAGWAKPSVGELLTGIDAEELSLNDERSQLPTTVWTLQDWLKCDNFATASFVANGYISASFGFDRGWDEQQAVALGKQIMRQNVERIFGV